MIKKVDETDSTNETSKSKDYQHTLFHYQKHQKDDSIIIHVNDEK